MRMLETARRFANVFQRERSGSLLVEALMGVLLFGMFATAMFLTLITGQESTRTGSDRVRGVYYTEQAIEVVKSIRDDSFSRLADGTHGFDLASDGSWILTGSVTSRYGYNTYVTITTPATGRKHVVAVSKWKHGTHRSGATVLTTELTNWRSAYQVGDWSSVTANSVDASGDNEMRRLQAKGDYVYVTDWDTDGEGLHVFDVSDPDSPTQVTTDEDFGRVYEVAINNDMLYLAVRNGSGNPEILAYDITDPENAFVNPVSEYASYNISGGNNRAKSLFVSDNILYVGANQDSGDPEFYALNISNSGAITLSGSLELGTKINDIYVVGDYAYLSADSNSQEMMIVDVSDPTSMSLLRTLDLNNVQDGDAVFQANTGYYLGRDGGSSIDELVMITGSGGYPSAEPTDQYTREMGNDIEEMTMDSLGCYIFIATRFGSKELQIVNAKDKLLPEETYYSTTYNGRGVFYNATTDDLYFATDEVFWVFQPTSDSGPCS